MHKTSEPRALHFTSLVLLFSPMSLTISRFEDIDLLESINGVPIIEIERRSRPLIRDEISNEFKYDPVEFPRTVEEEDYTNLLRETRSQIGFLGTLYTQPF